MFESPVDRFGRTVAGAWVSEVSHYYDWAWIATDHPRRQLLIRRSIADPSEIAYFYAYAPAGRVCSLTDLVKIAGARWKVEDDFQDSKSTVGLDQTQVRLYRAWKRHVTLAMAALAFLAVLVAIEKAASAPWTRSAHDPEVDPLGPLVTRTAGRGG